MRIATLLLFLSLATVTCAAGRVFVTNERSDSVSVIDIETNKVVKTIPVGNRPRGIGLAPDGSEIYVAVSGDNHIAVIDRETLEVVRTFPSGDDPETFDVHNNGNIYISNEEDAKASVYNPKTGELIAEIEVGIEPEGVAISPDGMRVIITSESSNMLHLIDIPGHTIIHNILVGARPRAATFSADSKTAYATSEISGEVKKIDVASGTIIGKVVLSDDKAKPKDILLSRDGNRLFVAGGRANRVFVLEAQSLEIIKAIAVGKRVWSLALSRDGKRLYSTDGVDHQVSVIDTDSNSVATTIPVGKFPWGIAIDD
ncbi:MAG: PQQ-dependent catabolism-associated beta-propeller protein [Pseudomonadota bacterium]|nr:PQQ-dependent catabolism-associated beta-propeller protein [Pseudomonadota bacterium]